MMERRVWIVSKEGITQGKRQEGRRKKEEGTKAEIAITMWRLYRISDRNGARAAQPLICCFVHSQSRLEGNCSNPKCMPRPNAKKPLRKKRKKKKEKRRQRSYFPPFPSLESRLCWPTQREQRFLVRKADGFFWRFFCTREKLGNQECLGKARVQCSAAPRVPFVSLSCPSLLTPPPRKALEIASGPTLATRAASLAAEMQSKPARPRQ